MKHYLYSLILLLVACQSELKKNKTFHPSGFKLYWLSTIYYEKEFASDSYFEFRVLAKNYTDYYYVMGNPSVGGEGAVTIIADKDTFWLSYGGGVIPPKKQLKMAYIYRGTGSDNNIEKIQRLVKNGTMQYEFFDSTTALANNYTIQRVVNDSVYLYKCAFYKVTAYLNIEPFDSSGFVSPPQIPEPPLMDVDY